jgi:hypothetical protein
MRDDMHVPIEGHTLDEIVNMGDDEADTFVFKAGPVVFSLGSATLLGEIKRTTTTLVLEIAQIEGGGEGVLLSLWVLAHRYARARRLDQIEWIVHAVDCVRPNARLQQVLARKGFVVEEVPGYGLAYHLLSDVSRRK